MQHERIKETIKFDTEVIKLLWIAFIADIGGTASVGMNLDTLIRIFVVSLGIIIAIGLFISISITFRRIRRLINLLED